jgi:hypothetical protein
LVVILIPRPQNICCLPSKELGFPDKLKGEWTSIDPERAVARVQRIRLVKEERSKSGHRWFIPIAHMNPSSPARSSNILVYYADRDLPHP